MTYFSTSSWLIFYRFILFYYMQLTPLYNFDRCFPTNAVPFFDNSVPSSPSWMTASQRMSLLFITMPACSGKPRYFPSIIFCTTARIIFPSWLISSTSLTFDTWPSSEIFSREISTNYYRDSRFTTPRYSQ